MKKFELINILVIIALLIVFTLVFLDPQRMPFYTFIFLVLVAIQFFLNKRRKGANQ